MGAGQVKLGVVMVLQNAAETVEQAIRSFYEHVDAILISTDPKRGWSGVPVVPDDTLERAVGLDRRKIIEVIEGDFCVSKEPLQNEARQRQLAADELAGKRPDLDWILQIDGDEVFLDFPAVVSTLRSLRFSWVLYWNWIVAFNKLDDGRLLVVADARGRPRLEPFPLAYRPRTRLKYARHPLMPFWTLNGHLLGRRQGGRDPSEAVLHYAYARSPQSLYQKLKSWGHANDFDTDAYFELWKSSKENWAQMRNFHPIYPRQWPALVPISVPTFRGGQGQ